MLTFFDAQYSGCENGDRHAAELSPAEPPGRCGAPTPDCRRDVPRPKQHCGAIFVAVACCVSWLWQTEEADELSLRIQTSQARLLLQFSHCHPSTPQQPLAKDDCTLLPRIEPMVANDEFTCSDEGCQRSTAGWPHLLKDQQVRAFKMQDEARRDPRVPYEPSLALECGHRFCTPCWASYLTAAIESGDAGSLQCKMVGCHSVLIQELMAQLAGPAVLQQYENNQDWAYVQVHPQLVGCT